MNGIHIYIAYMNMYVYVNNLNMHMFKYAN